jgi:hypothetical protein
MMPGRIIYTGKEKIKRLSGVLMFSSKIFNVMGIWG